MQQYKREDSDYAPLVKQQQFYSGNEFRKSCKVISLMPITNRSDVMTFLQSDIKETSKCDMTNADHNDKLILLQVENINSMCNLSI